MRTSNRYVNIKISKKPTNSSRTPVRSTFPNTAFAEMGRQMQCAAGISHWEFVSVSALCRLQSTGSSLLPVAVSAGSFARLCGLFKTQSAPLPAGSRASFSLRQVHSLFRLPAVWPISPISDTMPQFSCAMLCV